MSLGEIVLLVLAGAGAGLTGSIAGLASLVSYPALLAVGLPPVTANVTNTVSLVFGTVGSVTASAPELRGRRRRVARLAVVGAAGGALGGVLLLTTPAHAFERLVPWLIGAASLAVLVAPRRVVASSTVGEGSSPALYAAIFAVGVYGGYFGAAAGVMMLALLARGATSLPVANAVKNVVLGAANGVAAVGFAIFAPVDWYVAFWLACGLLAGATLGPAIVRRTRPRLLRVVIALAGLGLAVHLGINGV